MVCGFRQRAENSGRSAGWARTGHEPENLFRAAAAGVLLALFAVRAANLAPFYRIERYERDGVLLHFDTAAFHKYELQSTTDLATAGAANVRWTNVYTVPSVPFANHYVVLDSITNAPVKWYRIVVTP